MIRYACDWCGKDFPGNRISTVKIGNSTSKGIYCHICWDCGRVHMPERAQSLLSWTAPVVHHEPPPPTDDDVAAAKAILSHPKIKR